MEEGREIGVRANVQKGRTADGVYWKRSSGNRRKNAKIKSNEAKQQDRAFEILLERVSIEVLKSANAEGHRADEKNLHRVQTILIGSSQCTNIATSDSGK
jgi:hypothetical protein